MGVDLLFAAASHGVVRSGSAKGRGRRAGDVTSWMGMLMVVAAVKGEGKIRFGIRVKF